MKAIQNKAKNRAKESRAAFAEEAGGYAPAAMEQAIRDEKPAKPKPKVVKQAAE
jgi:hypothetical protein